MIIVNRDNEWKFVYDPVQSGIEGRFVSNYLASFPADQISVLFPSGTAGVEIWANNSKEYIKFAQESYKTFDQPQNFGQLAPFNQIDPSFSGNWVNITTNPNVTWSASSMFLEGTVRYLRLGGGGITGSTSATIGFLFCNFFHPAP